MLEIERKFLMDGFPIGLELLAEVEIEQGYISFNPEVRIRKAVDRFTGKEEFWLTIKGDGDVARDEIETEITSDFYYDTLDFLGVRMIQKGKELTGHDGQGKQLGRIAADQNRRAG